MNIEIVVDTGRKDEANDPIVEVVRTCQVKSRDEAKTLVDKLRTEDNKDYLYRVQHEAYRVLYMDNTSCISSEYSQSESIMRKWISSHKAEVRMLKKVANRGDVSDRTKSLVKKIGKIRKFMGNRFVKSTIDIASKVCNFYLSWWLWDKWHFAFRDWRHERNRIAYFKKHHHDKIEPWSLDTHILSDLRWNLRRLIDESHGIPELFCDEARKEGISDARDVLKRANDIRKDAYTKMINLIDMYNFYSFDDICQDDETSLQLEAIRYPNSIDEDYTAMSAKAQALWDEIMDMLKKYGRTMFD